MNDQLGNPIHIKQIPKRIISLVPSQTELVVDLGMRKSLVGITKFCVHPKSLKSEVEMVGGTKSVHLDKIEALQPDLILCNKEENTPEMVKALQQIAEVHVADVTTFSDAYQLISDYGKIFQQQEKAEELVADIQNQFTELRAIQQSKQEQKVTYFIWKNPWMVAANHTFINSVLNELGLKNAFAHLERYPEVDLQNLPETDWIFLSSEPFPFKKDDFSAFVDKRLKLEVVDGESFSWFGSRMKKTFPYFKELLEKLNS
ncbi:ABC transporter substrate-binding protein [Psychroflexus planctonicus]|uniref:Iron ABC transporter n=1 Tax=Psychroflexus planctonicus TaxID=1526575 RepID=A0ABQ1SDI7_9FLAO|nr:helical backbone metal receptor [Psychroflexus planctonicus]GGE31142.1 iron ABC transporter [Psychroflexus planctonicus]